MMEVVKPVGTKMHKSEMVSRRHGIEGMVAGMADVDILALHERMVSWLGQDAAKAATRGVVSYVTRERSKEADGKLSAAQVPAQREGVYVTVESSARGSDDRQLAGARGAGPASV